VSFAPIAVVGRSCILPGALSTEALADAVVAGRDLVGSAPAGRWGVDPVRVTTPDPARAQDRTWSDRGGYVHGFDAIFDPTGFAGLAPEEALGLDPLFRWTLHGVRAALREAGFEGSSDRAGLVLGNLSFPPPAMARFAEATWLDGLGAGWLGGLAPELARRTRPDPRNRFSSGLPAHLAASANGLRGGAFALDAACASALYAIKLACDRLHDGEADLVVAGAVNRADDLFLHVGFCALSALSRTGRSRPFHRDADGLLPAEGAGFVVLERLPDALAAGNTVYGVIHGVGLSNDGRARGFLAPSAAGQVRALRSAYAQAGWDPASVSLLECHATGTPVGDAVEIQSLAEVFAGATEVPLGSLKSNLGHLITAAGAAGLIKVLGSFERALRPPTLHAGEPLDALDGTPFRLLHEAEPWDCEGPRRAAVSAFGFGGNNAHLLVQEPVLASAPAVLPPRAPEPVPVAVVGIAARAGEATSTVQTLHAAVGGPSLVRDGAARAEQVDLSLEGLRFPPRDLERTLPQQLLVLRLALEATDSVTLPAERTSVLVGMGCDPEIARYGARWRLPDWADAWGAAVGVSPDAAWLEAARDAFAPTLEAAGVVGTMPNVPANRVNRQLGAAGPSFTVSSEESSGVRALALAARALRGGEIDAALVGAADFSDEPVHRSAAADLLPVARQVPGDGGVVLVLKRLADAERDGDRVLAVLPGESVEASLHLGLAEGAEAVTNQLGHAHAASGLLHVAAAVAACRHGVRPDGTPWSAERVAKVTVDALGGERVQVTVVGHGAPTPIPVAEGEVERLVFPAHGAAIALEPLPEATPVQPARPERGRMAPAPVLDGAASAGPRAGSSPKSGSGLRVPGSGFAGAEVSMGGAASARGSGISPGRPAVALAPTVPPPPRSPTPGARRPAAAPVLAAHAAFQARLSEIHRAHLAQQQALHEQFLATRAQATTHLLRAWQGFASAPPPHPTPPTSAPSIPEPGARSPEPLPPAPGVLPGPKWDRAQLEILGSGKISRVFGPLFARQDDFRRQVRMPMPPLLLADRVTGLDAEPGSMTTGTIWTETDVTEDAWYLHDGRMPAGLMIESGQADLLLISWLGADFENRGERIYRLLGCTLTYHGDDGAPGTVLPGPGETLEYEIHVDGHARQGPIRLFFFHYDCHVDGKRRLTVRGGQAGFFTDEELADSGGILWKPETGDHDPAARLDPPRHPTGSSFSREQVRAFAAGRPWACFGAAHDPTRAQVWPPRIAGGDELFLDEVSVFDPFGGPWGRGYLRAEWPVSPYDWFFDGHFKDDPCMPGTLMFEGCVQALAFYLAALGYAVDKDGWRFEPVPDLAYEMWCRGQVTPSSRHLVYEVFVEEVHDGPHPTIFADLLCTVDGLEAFHARRVGLRLVPDWPLSRPEGRRLLRRGPIPGHIDPRVALARPAVERDGFRYDLNSLLACAWGRPTEAFGPIYAPFDSARKVARLPGAPYHFMTRITALDAEAGSMRADQAVTVAYDVPPAAWYFRENGAAVMPFAVLMEAALQPCGWLASFVGCALSADRDLLFRNLDGAGTLHRAVRPEDGTLLTTARLTRLSRSGGMILVAFDVACRVGDEPIFEMDTVFGFFPPEAFVDQAGVGTTPQWTEALRAPSDVDVDLAGDPAPFFGGPAALARPMLRMIDRITLLQEDGGAHGQGRIRAEKAVDPEEWFFKAHFYSDPVQPGSLGVEALCQVLQAWMLHRQMDAGMAAPRFEPVMSGLPTTWKYRGQVVPDDAVITSACDIVEEGRDERGPYVVAQGSLWVDGKRIYHLERFGMRLVDGLAPVRPGGDRKPTQIGLVADPPWEAAAREEVLDPATDPWLADHCPTWTVPALPMMAMVDRLAAAAGGAPVRLQDVVVHRWLPVDGPVRLRTEASPRPDGGTDVRLLAWREAATVALSRFEPVASGVAWPEPGPAPEPLAPPADASPAPDPYAAATLFHGPAFQRLTALSVGATGASATLDATPTSVPLGALHPALLDAATHALPHDDVRRWDPALPEGHAAYPIRLVQGRFFAPMPTHGAVRVEARYLGAEDAPGGPRPRFRLQILGDRVLADLVLEELLLPKGPIGQAAPADRLAFLRDRRFVPGLGLSTAQDGATTATRTALRASDWLPGTVAAVYGGGEDLVARVAAADHVAARAGVHPSRVRLDGEVATTLHLPLTRWPLAVGRTGEAVTVRGEAVQDLSAVRAWWREWFALGHWPVEDLYYGLIEHFVRRVVLEDPEGFDTIRGRSALYLANHQVMVESLLFSVIVSALSGVRTVTLAKIEHQQSWLGRLIAHSFAWPGARDPEVIAFFDREDKSSLPRIIGELAKEMAGPGKSVMVHVEGTRSLRCGVPVQKITGAFIDMALATNSPIVPVRFAGGLPREPLPARIEFPLGHGRQDYVLGSPILPETLAPLPYKERKERVIAAIAATGPAHETEDPFPGDPTLQAASDAWAAQTGAEPAHATLLEVLRAREGLHPAYGR